MVALPAQGLARSLRSAVRHHWRTAAVVATGCLVENAAVDYKTAIYDYDRSGNDLLTNQQKLA